jgi:hypothetical protein
MKKLKVTRIILEVNTEQVAAGVVLRAGLLACS